MGILSTEALATIFRSLSQKRKSGVLHVQTSLGGIDIIMVAGKIAEVLVRDVCEVEGMLAVLDRTGLLPEHVGKEELGIIHDRYPASIQKLKSELRSRFGISVKDFNSVRLAIALDYLHQLHANQQGAYTFESRYVPVPDDISLNLSTGQLLLDFVDYEVNLNRFVELVEANGGVNAEVGVVDNGGVKTDAERRILEVLARDGNLGNAFRKVMLCGNDARSAFLSLVEQGSLAFVVSRESQGMRSDMAVESKVEEYWDLRVGPGDDLASDVKGRFDGHTDGDVVDSGATVTTRSDPSVSSSAWVSEICQHSVGNGPDDAVASPFSDRLALVNYWCLEERGVDVLVAAIAMLIILVAGLYLPYYSFQLVESVRAGVNLMQ